MSWTLTRGGPAYTGEVIQRKYFQSAFAIFIFSLNYSVRVDSDSDESDFDDIGNDPGDDVELSDISEEQGAMDGLYD